MKSKIQNIKKFLIEKVLLHEYENLPADTERILQAIRREKPDFPVIYVSSGTGGVISGSEATFAALRAYLEPQYPEASIIMTGCTGPLNYEPFICIQLPGKNKLFFRNITEEKVEPLLNGVFHNDIPDEDIVGQSGNEDYGIWNGVPFMQEVPFFARQKRVILGNCGCYDPESIEEYIARGGYFTFLKTIRNYTHAEVCDIVEKSGLRGRSGGGYNTGMKWKSALSTSGSSRYLICNAKESDPGSFTDRTILESDPHRLLEGIALAAYAIDATTAIIYLRSGSPVAHRRIAKAVEQAGDYGLTGHNIFSSGFNLDIQLRIEPGAFVCGEETALIASIEGKRGMPRLKPPYPASFGLLGKPTVINNVETLMNVPLIMQNGPDWFRSMGTECSPGTKVFSISGKGRFTGVVEVEMGTSLKYILEEIADGIRDGGKFRAVGVGGPSGFFLDETSLDIRVDFDQMKENGISMGSGGFIIADTSVCMVDLVKYYMDFIHRESCGKCIPCREGTARMFEILENVMRKPKSEDSLSTLERFKGVMQLESIASVMKDASLCGLGQTAPNPFLSALEKFRDEFEEHIFDRKCRANICRGLRTFLIDVDKCTGCTACATRCPENAIYGTRLQPYFIVEEKCSGCGKCFEVCKFSAVIIK